MKFALDVASDPRVLPLKQQLLQEYQRRTQTAKVDVPSDSEVMKVTVTQLRRTLNSLSYSNLKKTEQLHNLHEVYETNAKDLQAASSNSYISLHFPHKTNQANDVCSELTSEIESVEEKVDNEEFTESQLRHMILTVTENIVAAT